MKYTKFQRYLSFLTLFFFLFSTTIHFPIPGMDVFAEDEWYKNIVSIIVEEETYKWISAWVDKYAKNISEALWNTQVVIFPTPYGTPAYEIASLNESLYNQWLSEFNDSKWGKLVWTVLIGKLDIPIVYEWNESQKSIVPYVDFSDKYFTYNHEIKKFQKNDNNKSGLWAEIWHWVINPNEWENPSADIKLINEYLDKNNDFYQGTWEFSNDKILLNWNQDDIVDEKYEPYVFYFDQIREFQASSLESYQAYNTFLNYKEDIIYQRYTQTLAEKIQKEILGSHEESVENLADIFGDEFSWDALLASSELDSAIPDIQTRFIINNTTKQFVEIFSKWSIGTLRKNVYNAWRYNYDWNDVNVDFIPYLVTLLDSVNDEIVKEAIIDLENHIDEKVESELQKDIYVPYKVEESKSSHSKSFTDTYVNLLYGKSPQWISNVSQCSPYFGESQSGQLVLANRGINTQNISIDMDFLTKLDESLDTTRCVENIENGLTINSIYGGNTPINIDPEATSENWITLKSSNLNNSIVEISDIKWGYKTSASFTAPSYSQCLQSNFFAYTLHEVDDRFSSPEVYYQLPALWKLPDKNQYDCRVPAKKEFINADYNSLAARGLCTWDICVDDKKTYYFKKISSIYEHKEPSLDTIKKQIEYGLSPNLPVDKVRYVDFQNTAGEYQKINYPALFNFPFTDSQEDVEFTIENINTDLQSYFENNVSNFADIDLYKYLQDKPTKTLIVWEDERDLKYYDALVFAIYWSNLNSASAKYQFILENYLGDSFQENEKWNDLAYHLPKWKKQYEIAYLGARGDGETMHVQLNPEAKWDNPYADIIESNANLQSELLGQNISWTNQHDYDNTFKCAPPEGVPIFEWLPAVVCWIDDILPPTISVSDSTCWTTLPLLSNEQQEFIAQCNWDEDKNWVNDCLETSLNWWTIDLKSEHSSYYINQPWSLTASLLDSSENIIVYNDSSNIEFKLVKVEIAEDNSKELTSDNIKTVFNGWELTQEVKKYISFTPWTMRSNSWKAETLFASRWQEANYYFQAEVTLQDDQNNNVIVKNSDIIKVEVRADKLFSQFSTLFKNDDNQVEINSSHDDIEVNDQSQIFVIDSQRVNKDELKNIIYSENALESKTLLSLNQKNKNWVFRDINYPINIIAKNNSDEILFDELFEYSDLSRFKALPWITYAWDITFEIIDNSGQVTETVVNFSPADASNLDVNLWANIIESGWAITTNAITVLDKYDNPLIWERLTIESQIQWNSIMFAWNASEKISANVIEWYQLIRLESLNKTWISNIDISVKDISGNELLSKTVQVRVVDEIDISLSDIDLTVGWDSYTLNIKIWDSSVFDNFNSRVYFNISNIYAQVSQPYFDVVNGKAEITLSTKSLSNKSVPVEIQVEWLKKIYTKELEIKHWEPKYIQLWSTSDWIEASGESTEIQVFLKDEYWNITYGLNWWTVEMEVAEDFEKFLDPATASISQGIAKLEPTTSTIPWIAYYKVSYGELETAGMLETYFHWDGESITNGGYNSLYTTLLWAPYADVTQKNYLAKSLLFNRDNRSLAVTWLLNSPYKFSDVISVEYGWAISNVSDWDDLSTDIVFTPELEAGKLVVNARNISMWDYVAKITPSFWEEANLVLCNATNWNFSTCLDVESTTISLQSQNQDYELFKSGQSLYIQNKYWEKIFSVDELWNIEKSAGLYLDLVDNGQKYLQINILSWQDIIGSFVYNFVDSQVLSTRLYESKIENPKNSIIISLSDELYAARNEYGEGNYNKVIYYNDPFSVDGSLNSMSNWNAHGYENFEEQWWTWWFEWNKTLLNFAAWETVWESLKPFQSFSVVNLWDPVLKLKKIQRELPKADGELRDFDSTIWTLISDDPNMESFQLFDYNNDDKQDVLIIWRDKYLEVLENTWKWHQITFNRWNIWNIFDLWNPDHVVAGDFWWDWFDDIFFINDQWEPSLFTNNKWDFTRGSLLLQFGNLSGVQQVKVMDMDDDGLEDIIILDKVWKINIYYGWVTQSNNLFKFYKNWSIEELSQNVEIGISIVDKNIVLTPKYKEIESDVWNIYPYLWTQNNLQVCENLNNCNFWETTTVTFWNVSSEFNLIKSDSLFDIEYNWNSIFSVSDNSEFEKSFNTSLKFTNQSNNNWLEFEVYFKDILVTTVVIKLENSITKNDKIYEVEELWDNNNYFIVDWDDEFNISNDINWDYILSYNDNLPVFDNKYIWTVELPDITNGTRSDNWAVYFSWLPGDEESWDLWDIILESEEFMDKIQENVDQLHQKEWEKINTSWLNNLIYVWIPYKTTADIGWAQWLIDSIPETWVDDWWASTSLELLLWERDVYLSYPETTNNASVKNFIRSEYASSVWVDVVKNYWGSIYNESMNFEVTITNNSWENLENFAYAESIINPFQLDLSSLWASKWWVNISYTTPWFDFMIDWFNLLDWESVSVSGILKVPKINMWTIEVWYFEEDTQDVVDDNFGDIIYKPTNQNCSQWAQAFYSCETSDKGLITRNDCKEFSEDRYYSKAQEKIPSCDEEKIKLPATISNNAQDSNNNWVPDYIDDLTSWDSDAISDYSNDALSNILQDSDNDGVPDYEDNTNSDKDLLSNLEDINENIDHVVTWVDNIIQWLSCGFGGWWCIATPLNWAPLAPGWDPTLFWVPIWDGLSVWEGIPVFSALTWIYYGPICGPSVWPVSPLAEWCTWLWAWWQLGIDSASNFFRLFVTPTLTWGMWVAACFGWPARVAWYSNMPGLSPLLPGWNCIVTAMPLAACSSDGSNWDPSSVGFSQWSAWWSKVFNANCNVGKSQIMELEPELVEEFIKYKQTWNKSENFENLFKESFTKIAQSNYAGSTNTFNKPLIEVWGQSLDGQLEVSVDFSDIKSWNFEDILQIKNTRISSFPDFLMWWVTKQIEEIVTKLTDFPTVFIILPDFSGVLDFGSTTTDNMWDVISTDNNLSGLVWSENLKQANSWIKEAYTFLANIPLVKLEQENLAIDIPWISQTELENTIKKWWDSVDQRSTELERAKEQWSFWLACDTWDTACEEQYDISQKYVVNVENLIGSLEQNIEVLESYKSLPKDLWELVRKKEDYLEQILCNVEAISEILGWWIGKNWERFKAWVELYILIKAILKSWQLLIDVFIDFEAECHECKNERWDLMTFIWKLISAVIPDIPVIQFPKWPDIIIDLHNIRAGLTISLPEFTFSTRPMVLPNLPDLYLPDVPNVAINLPELPILPEITIPELPDLPNLPTVELPNLPPPPTLPKMFAQLEWILEIIKAIAKAMCILKTSPFVPEWRAWDQIAFITERQWYLPMDFLDVSLPQFSFPFVDAIEVTSYVNLEFETDFVTELARQVTMPLTTFSNDFTQILNLWVNDLDFRALSPWQLDINIWTDWVQWQVWLDNNKVYAFVWYISQWISQWVNYLDTQKNITVTNTEFKQLVAKSLGSEVFASHPKYGEFRQLWDEVFEYNFESEDKFIADLQQNNFEKFDTLENILHTEILKNKDLSENLDEYLKPKFIQNITSNSTWDVEMYNSQLDRFNQKFYDSVVDLTDNKPDPKILELHKAWEELNKRVSTPLQAYSEYLTDTPMFATWDSWDSSSHSSSQCYAQTQSEYSYDYDGLYAVETYLDEDYSYNLLDYKDELDWDEVLKTVDLDNDWDEDYLVKFRGQIYMKENLSIQLKTQHDYEVLTIWVNNNKFYNSDTYYAAVENFREGSIDSNKINAKFSWSTQDGIYNYRMTLNDQVNRSVKTQWVVDAFSNLDEQLYKNENELFTNYNNAAIIKNLWYLKYIELTTKEMKNIRDDIQSNKIVSLSQWTKLYAWDSTTRIWYVTSENNTIQNLIIPKHTHVSFKQSIKIVEITQNAYIQWRYNITLKWEEIRAYKWLPIFDWAHMSYVWNSIVPPRGNSYIDIEYFDGSQALINFNFVSDYWLYDLWFHWEDLAITLSTKNDYKYGIIQSFKDNIFSTYSNQIVLSPQIQADSYAPVFYMSELKIPVYQSRIMDLTDLVYEDSGLSGIKNIEINMNPESETTDEIIPDYKIIHTDNILKVVFGPYDNLFTRDISFKFTDVNANTSQYLIPFEVYAPSPEIDWVNDNSIYGQIDENLSDQPVSFYRFRAWEVTKLEWLDGQEYAWTNIWEYNLSLWDEESWLEVLYGNTLIAFINEITWNISLKDFTSNIKVFSSNHVNNDNYYPKIEIQKNNQTLYYQYLEMTDSDINVVENFSDIIVWDIAVKFSNTSKYWYQQIPNTLDYNPWSIVIYDILDNSKNPLFVIFPDGRIQTLNESYTLEYDSYDNYIKLRLMDTNKANQVAEVVYALNGGYVIE